MRKMGIVSSGESKLQQISSWSLWKKLLGMTMRIDSLDHLVLTVKDILSFSETNGLRE
jgi:hypothetical protein